MDLVLHNVEILIVKLDLFAYLLYSYIPTDMISKKSTFLGGSKSCVLVCIHKVEGSILFYVGLSMNLIKYLGSFAKTYLQGLLTIFIARDYVRYLAQKLVSKFKFRFGPGMTW